MEKKELWHEMLTTYCKKREYTGLTLPNMIGAYYCFDDSIDLSSSKCIAQLLEDITASQKDMVVLIQRCGNIGNYVLSPFKGMHPQHPKLNEKIYLGMYDKYLEKHSSDINMLAEYLYKLHREEIMEHKFSFEDEAWHPLTDTELRHINDIISSLK